ncbi:MAG: hypothetical protein V4754_14080, partial [Pseudomonadota bacterium]
MRGQRIGYVRVSSFDQNPERQLDQVQVISLYTTQPCPSRIDCNAV